MKPEVLAPCGDFESLKVAVQNGADAVYLGMGKFNARMRAENFGTNLQDAVNYCHLYGTKLYLTVNTLVKDEEMEEFLNEIHRAIECGIDAVIVQDFAIANILRMKYPTLEMHASTQMGIHNVHGAKFLEKLGFKRVVLSRETTLHDIKEIHEETNLDIEYFVQGALCVAFSGNCYMSQFVYGKSGNRGECKQLCRMCYDVKKDGNTLQKGYYLSPKDLCYIKQLKELVDAGVTSLKIEGRLRRSGYVATATHWYRNVVDHNFQVDNQAISELKLAFSRGNYQNRSYLDGKIDGIIESVYQNHTGCKIGQVIDIKPFKDLYQITLNINQTLHKNDGLKFYRNQVEVASLGVGNVEIDKKGNQVIFSKQKVAVGDTVHMILSKSMEDGYISIRRPLKVDMFCNIRMGQIPTLKLFSQGFTVTVQGEEFVEGALTKCITEEDVLQQLKKLNNDDFDMGKLIICLDDGCFVSKSVINNLRRKGLLLLKEEIIQGRKPRQEVIDVDLSQLRNRQSFDNFTKQSILVVDETNKEDADILLISPMQYNKQTIDTIQKNCHAKSYYLVLPVVANHKDIEVIDKLLEECQLDGVVIENYYGAKYIGKYSFIVGPRMNVYNQYALNAWKMLGAKLVITNYERSLDYSFAITGNIPLMLFCHCPYASTSGKGCDKCSYYQGMSYVLQDKNFQVRRYRLSRCYFELFGKRHIQHKNLVYDVREI